MSRGVTMKTPERVAQAAAMREGGARYREIAERFGISTSAAMDWVKDPDGRALRARKDAYAAPCTDCGAPTSGSEGRRDEPRCPSCAARHSAPLSARAARAAERREAIAVLWRNGKTLRQIAAALNSTTSSIGREMCDMRAAGWDLPHRDGYPRPRR